MTGPNLDQNLKSEMDSETFLEVVRRLISPALEPLGFVLHTSVSGRLYSAEFVSPAYVASISFEPGDDCLLVAVFTVTNGVRSDLDDRERTPRLSDLNRRFLSPSELEELHRSPTMDYVDNPSARKLVKAARELAVVLPRYVSERDAGS